MTILVTGAAGFIGAHVAEALLARGEPVIGVDNLNGYYSPQLKRDRLAALPGRFAKFRFVQTDFADQAALKAAVAGETIDRIVHLGAQAGVRHSLANPRAYAHSNLIGQLELLELARAHGVRHMLYASSSSVYGEAAVLPLTAEARADAPVSFYAATKKAGEVMAESYAHLYRLPLTGLRFFTVYGPWGRPDMAYWQFTRQLLAGEPLPLFNGGKMQRDFSWIGDIVAGVLAAFDRPPIDEGQIHPGGSLSPHAIYNLGNDRAETLSRFVDILAAACEVQPHVTCLPMQAGDVSATWADIGPARRMLGYDPAVSIDAGLPRFVEWYRKYTAA